MKTIISTAVSALFLTLGASASNADVVWHYPHKGAPYATTTEPATPVPAQRKARISKRPAQPAQMTTTRQIVGSNPYRPR